MQLSNIPPKIVVPFAATGSKRTIPVLSQIGVTPGAASFTDGFPPLTFTPLASGGIPPAGQDFNGILNAITLVQQWQAAGGSFAFDASWAASNNGYPKGALLMRADGTGFWFNTADNNTTDPDGATPTGWVPEWQYGITGITGLTNANVTLTSLQYGRPIITLAGALTGNVQVIFPALGGVQWLVVNNTTGSFSVTAKTAAGTGVLVPSGGQTPVWGDGTSLYSASAPGLLIGLRKFETPGAFTYVPTPGTRFILAEAVGGGGAGGGTPAAGAGNSATGGGGGGGGYGRKLITSGFSGITLTVGAAGVGALQANGGTGGASSVGAVLSCGGGTGGVVAVPSSVISFGSTPGGTGVVTGADIAVNSSPAVPATQFISLGISGGGGSSPLGAGQNGVALAGTNAAHGTAPSSFGKGGGGAGGISVGAASNTRGGDGQPGAIYLWEYA